MQAPVAPQLMRRTAFRDFLAWLVGTDCHHGHEQLPGTTEAFHQLVGFGWCPDGFASVHSHTGLGRIFLKISS